VLESALDPGNKTPSGETPDRSSILFAPVLMQHGIKMRAGDHRRHIFTRHIFTRREKGDLERCGRRE
jgi:hypothetical protein